VTRAVLTLPAYVVALRRHLRRLRPDVVHSHGIKMHVLAASAAPRGVAVLWHLHDHVGARSVSRRLLRLLTVRCAGAIAIASGVAADAERVFRRSIAVRCVPNGIDLDDFSPHGRTLDLDSLSGLRCPRPETVRVGLVATMAVWKGHEVFIRAVARLRRGRPFRAYVIGGPIYDTTGSQRAVDGLRCLARELGVESEVGFTGFVDDPASAMRALDIIVHASTRPEPFGLVVAEAMACGRAVVLSPRSGVAQFVTDDEDTALCPPDDVGALAATLERLIASASVRTRLGARARATAERCFDRRRMGAEIASVYRALVPVGG
jgi:glycosyltransferase involved in cell wall biosynthesis